MTLVEIKTKLHHQIDNSDEKLLKMIYALVGEYGNNVDDISETREKLIFAERERYLAGIGKSHTWEEVKFMAINKQTP